ncbi:MAG TPA: zinc-binding dehydrogenase [Anaerolineae bacterium]|nr:zinc-binding dehydrogenase [Anaerolineae bacterium]
MDRLRQYRLARGPLPERNWLWPLYGAGFENLGDQGRPVAVPMPRYGAAELLVRHDACGLCFSDVKVIGLGQNHPRIRRDMRSSPVVLGHEVSMTVVGVGETLRDQYRLGDRFIVQADINVGGVGHAYGYEIPGGLSQYGVIDGRVLNGDEGNYLVPVNAETGYAESALSEPWACVISAYNLRYRTGLKPGGTAWIIGGDLPAALDAQGLTIGAALDQASHPARLLLTGVPPGFGAWLRERAFLLNTEVIDVPDLRHPPVSPVDDIVVLGADAGVVEAASPHLAGAGVLAVVANRPMPRRVAVDVGRIHYDHWLYVGGTGPDLAQAYSRTPVRRGLKPGGRAWFAGAGGPMGRMHVQRAIETAGAPATIVCTDINEQRLADLSTGFGGEAAARGIEWLCPTPRRAAEYEAGMARFREQGFDDILVLAPVPAVITEGGEYLAAGGVMNVFAGVGRGTMAELELSSIYLKDVRIIGHSASSIDDLRSALSQSEAGQLAPNRSVAAVGSLSAAWEGLRAVRDTAFSGKVVLYPQIKEMPLTTLPELEGRLPSVFGRLKEGREWTVEAERELLRVMLP